MPTSRDIRRQFIDFFVERCGHTFVPSTPVVPHEDPTLLFTNAGMNQFKEVFLGLGNRPYTRAVNSQKCIRAGGKHNDLDDVGRDTYHHTFFEMLGNWSFGDYFKTEAIEWAWQLLTGVWKLDPARLHATYFEGDEPEGLAPDNEARDLWLRFLPPERVHPGNKKDNFWEMGDTGPCGPCSEIHYDGTADKSGASLVNRGDPNVIEIWNLVFIQFNRGQGGRLSPLPSKHVDTGMGFERIVRVLQGKSSNYDTDVFEPIFKAIEKITAAAPYGGDLHSSADVAYRVVADHARCLTFALTDGAAPSNEGRGYVLRRILRRAVRYGRQHLGAKGPFLHKLVEVIAGHMGDVFPELRKSPKDVAAMIRSEEESFGKTIDNGLELEAVAAADALEDRLREEGKLVQIGPSDFESRGEEWQAIRNEDARDIRTDELSTMAMVVKGPNGAKELVNVPVNPESFRKIVIRYCAQPPSYRAQDVFSLYDTHGFPLDLTQLMAEERGMTVDVAGFDALMEQARQRSRGEVGGADSARQSLVEWVAANKPAATRFVGYDSPVAESVKPLALLARTGDGYAPVDVLTADTEAAVVTDSTPFYAESGGQVGDTGVIHSMQGAVFNVTDTIKLGEVFVHLGSAEKGAPLSMRDTLLLEIDQPRRRRIMAHHTVTHLMNWALREVLGDHVQQRGSLVDDSKTRFDFSHTGPLTAEEVERVEKLVNDRIADDLEVYAEEADQPAAMEINGLRAVFGEKYPPRVRVVSIGVPLKKLLAKPAKKDWLEYSIEFCGGTHLARTSEALGFVLTAEEGVAKGVRRLTAVAGEKARRAAAHAEMLTSRIEALTGESADSLVQDLASCLEMMDLASLPMLARQSLRQKIDQLQTVVKEDRKRKQKDAEASVVDAAREIAESAEGPIIIASIAAPNAEALRKAVDVIRSKRPDSAMLLAAVAEGKVLFIAAVARGFIDKGLKAGDWVREASKVTGGGGGGRPDMAQAGGKDPTKLEDALDRGREFAEETLGIKV